MKRGNQEVKTRDMKTAVTVMLLLGLYSLSALAGEQTGLSNWSIGHPIRGSGFREGVMVYPVRGK